MRVLPDGPRAWLLELASADERRRLDAALVAAPPTGVVDVVPAAVTVLVVYDRDVTEADRAALETVWAGAQDAAAGAGAGRALTLDVRYDGPDLAETATLLGTSVDGLIAWHTQQVWTCDFCGFMPGFGYLVAPDARDVPRLAEPRPVVPAGSVALAGPYSGVYPGGSAGGWRLLGATAPRELQPGDQVTFRALR